MRVSTVTMLFCGFLTISNHHSLILLSSWHNHPRLIITPLQLLLVLLACTALFLPIRSLLTRPKTTVGSLHWHCWRKPRISVQVERALALLGSVSNYCLHNAHCPVLVVKKP